MNRLFRPSDQYENEQYQQVKNNVFSEFSSGIYTKMDDIISICNIIYDTHETILKESIKKIDTLSLIIFAIEQYEEYAKENSKYYNRQLSENDEKQWLEYPSYSRRGIKYLIEYLCQFYTTITHMDKKMMRRKMMKYCLTFLFRLKKCVLLTYVSIVTNICMNMWTSFLTKMNTPIFLFCKT